MGQEIAAPGALVVACKVARGLHVRTETLSPEDGPFRESGLTQTVVELAVHPSWRRRRRRSKWLVVPQLLAPSIALCATLIIAGGEAFAVAGLIFMLATIATAVPHVVAARRHRVRLFAIERDQLALASGPLVPLADIRGAHVRDRYEQGELGSNTVHDVVIDTPAGEVTAATTATAAQARDVVTMIETAHQSFLRRQR